MVFLHGLIPGGDLGITIIVLTAIIRSLFIPLSIKTLKSQKSLKDIAPQVEEIKVKYKNDATAQSSAVLKLYKDNKINPLAGCLPLLIQLPILIALYQVFIKGISDKSLELLYSFISRPDIINQTFLGLFDITQSSHLLTLIAGGLQFIQSKQSLSLQADKNTNKEMAAFSRQMLYFFPIMIIIIGWNLPAGLVLYWVTTTIFSIFESRFALLRT